MKKSSKIILRLLTLFFCVLLYSTCKKDSLKFAPVITIDVVTDITSVSATTGGDVTSDGGARVEERGICWSSINQIPSTSDNKIPMGNGTGSFKSTLSDLEPGKTYYVRAYATNSIGTSYSDVAKFTTLVTAPTISTKEGSLITINSLTTGGTILNDGGSPVTARGVCWSTKENPTISDNKTEDGTGVGNFTSNVVALTPGTTYFIRAYATNSIGTIYGNQITVKTSSTLPSISNTASSLITAISVVINVDISNDGGAEISSKGICWSTKQNPTISDNKISNGSGSGSFTSTIINLIPNTTYYVRAFATNSIGTSYSNELSFNTLALKNYLRPSYELRKSDIWVDYYSIPRSNGLNLNFTYAYDCAIADFNQDGFDDVLMVPSPWLLTYKRFPLELYLNDMSNNKFKLDQILISNNIGTIGAANTVIGDFNGDSKPDVYFPDGGADIGYQYGGTFCSIMLSSENGYEFKILEELTRKRYARAASGDIDGDGDLDIFQITGDFSVGEFLINDGKANFTVNQSMFQFQSLGVFNCQMVDINKDGYLDILLGGHAITSYEMKCSKVLWGNGQIYSDSNSTDLPNVPGWGVSDDFAVEDIDNDGNNEIIINRTQGRITPGFDEIDHSTYFQGYRLQILKNTVNNNYEDITEKIITDYSFTTGNGIRWLLVMDIDKNGKMDMFDSDKGHYNTGKSIRWEQDVDGIFKRKY